MNLMQIFSQTPKQFMQQMMNNNKVMSNPMIKNAMSMVQSGDTQGIEQMARNLCKEKGLNPDDVMNQLKSNFNSK
jgi:hypothetical protein|nr:MAG TPA_asm: hypothetical protein [Bacteriophage sp.]